MGKITTVGLSWAERLVLIDKYKATDEQATAAFDIQLDELTTARELQGEGALASISEGFDPEAYSGIFANVEGAGTGKRPATTTPPETTTKVTPTPKKRGRKGSKIAEAFAAIDTNPIDAEKFAAEKGVSLNVLRQAKRFDKTGGARVRVKKIDGTLKVFREAE